MTIEHQHERESSHSKSTLAKAKLVLVAFLIVAGYVLFTEHRAHLDGVLYYLPFLFLLACPLMHMFMHGGHGGHHAKRDNDEEKRNA